MSEMIDRVAEDIWQAEWTRAGNRGNRRVPWSDNSEEHMDRYRFLARAAIEAIEPLVEQAFKDGVAIGSLYDIPDPDAMWMASKARSSLKEQEEGN